MSDSIASRASEPSMAVPASSSTSRIWVETLPAGAASPPSAFSPTSAFSPKGPCATDPSATAPLVLPTACMLAKAPMSRCVTTFSQAAPAATSTSTPSDSPASFATSVQTCCKSCCVTLRVAAAAPPAVSHSCPRASASVAGPGEEPEAEASSGSGAGGTVRGLGGRSWRSPVGRTAKTSPPVPLISTVRSSHCFAQAPQVSPNAGRNVNRGFSPSRSSRCDRFGGVRRALAPEKHTLKPCSRVVMCDCRCSSCSRRKRCLAFRSSSSCRYARCCASWPPAAAANAARPPAPSARAAPSPEPPALEARGIAGSLPRPTRAAREKRHPEPRSGSAGMTPQCPP
mmetsp:Transcript_26257/g.74694  ORF Transcript_26257/g.74694 Transcript_26257/m.74694 type:complete len:342 (-) Transcript_26257:26-1051(-)